MKLFMPLILGLSLLGVMDAQTSGSYPAGDGVKAWYVGTVSLPLAATTVAVPANAYTATTPTVVFVDQINLYNTSASTVTVTITDNSTNCNGAACSMAIDVTAKTLYPMRMSGSPFSGGIKWSASVANVINASMIGRY
jgi:hypothetical protein